MKSRIAIIVVILLFSCGRWKVTKLRSHNVCTINNGTDSGNVMLKYDEDGLLEISFYIHFYNNNIYAIDNILKRIQKFKMDGTPRLVIGDKKDKPSKTGGVRYSYFNFSIIGSIAIDSNENIYVQNRFAASKRHRRSRVKKDMDYSPSYILVFNKKGNLLYTLGQRGRSDIPFYYIDNIEVDRLNRLFVVSRSFDTWSVFRFTDRKRDFRINVGEIDFKEAKGDDFYIGRIENIDVFHNGESLLVSVAYYHELEFKYRKIYEYSIKGEGIKQAIIDIPEPKNVLFTSIEDKLLYLWDVDGKKVKFIICNYSGDIINNVLIKFPKRNRHYESIQADKLGNIYSYHVEKDEIKIFEWR